MPPLNGSELGVSHVGEMMARTAMFLYMAGGRFSNNSIFGITAHTGLCSHGAPLRSAACSRFLFGPLVWSSNGPAFQPGTCLCTAQGSDIHHELISAAQCKLAGSALDSCLLRGRYPQARCATSMAAIRAIGLPAAINDTCSVSLAFFVSSWQMPSVAAR